VKCQNSIISRLDSLAGSASMPLRAEHETPRQHAPHTTP